MNIHIDVEGWHQRVSMMAGHIRSLLDARPNSEEKRRALFAVDELEGRLNRIAKIAESAEKAQTECEASWRSMVESFVPFMPTDKHEAFRRACRLPEDDAALRDESDEGSTN